MYMQVVGTYIASNVRQQLIINLESESWNLYVKYFQAI